MMKTFRKSKLVYDEYEVTNDNIFEYLQNIHEDEVLGYISVPHEPNGITFRALTNLAHHPKATKKILDKLGLELKVKGGG